MSYTKLTFQSISEDNAEILTAILGEFGCDYFDEFENNFNAYIPSENFKEEELISFLREYPIFEDVAFSKEEIPHTNWNAEWERNFSPILIGNNWSIRASFHDKQHTDNEIVINPKMSFGTGHHATTAMMIEMIDLEELQNKSVFDYGSGTGILAIQASMKGANPIIANDIEDWAYENSIENASINNTNNIEFIRGDLYAIPEKKYDVLIANINRNIILDSLEEMMKRVHDNSVVFVSGILNIDEDAIENAFLSYDFVKVNRNERDNWLCLKMVKNEK
jgi:ribosomal protein L11 methyltransferase